MSLVVCSTSELFRLILSSCKSVMLNLSIYESAFEWMSLVLCIMFGLFGLVLSSYKCSMSVLFVLPLSLCNSVALILSLSLRMISLSSDCFICSLLIISSWLLTDEFWLTFKLTSSNWFFYSLKINSSLIMTTSDNSLYYSSFISIILLEYSEVLLLLMLDIKLNLNKFKFAFSYFSWSAIFVLKSSYSMFFSIDLFVTSDIDFGLGNID